MKPTINTSDVEASWMTAGISPSSFEKSIKSKKALLVFLQQGL